MCTFDKSKSVYHQDGADTIGNGGTVVVIPDPSDEGNIYNTLTVVNDSDQDIKVAYKTHNGYDGEFIVPVSIKGFTRVLKSSKFDNLNFKVFSMANSAAVGNITFNLSN